jgi:hypothetical protein
MNILEKANELVNGDRQQDYGDPWINHARIAALWQLYLVGRFGDFERDDVYVSNRRVDIEATDAAMMMILVKVARLMESPNHTDSYVDLAGYAQVAQRCAEVDYGNEQDV